MANLAPFPKFRAFDSNGNPLAGGKLYTYLAGTSTKASTFTDSTGAVPNTNPVVLDADGEADVWLGDFPYKFVLKDENEVEQWTVDNIPSGGGGGGGDQQGVWIEHEITDGQSATDLVGQDIDGAEYSSAIHQVEIIRGTTVFASGFMAMQYLNGSWRVLIGPLMTDGTTGITFSVTQEGSVGTLRAAASSGPGSGTVKLNRMLVPA